MRLFCRTLEVYVPLGPQLFCNLLKALPDCSACLQAHWFLSLRRSSNCFELTTPRSRTFKTWYGSFTIPAFQQATFHTPFRSLHAIKAFLSLTALRLKYSWHEVTLPLRRRYWQFRWVWNLWNLIQVGVTASRTLPVGLLQQLPTKHPLRSEDQLPRN